MCTANYLTLTVVFIESIAINFVPAKNLGRSNLSTVCVFTNVLIFQSNSPL